MGRSGRLEHSQNVIHKKNKKSKKKKRRRKKKRKILKSNVLSVPGAKPCGSFFGGACNKSLRPLDALKRKSL